MLEDVLVVLEGGPGDEVVLEATELLGRAFTPRITLLLLQGHGLEGGRGWEIAASRHRRSDAEAELAHHARELDEALRPTHARLPDVKTVSGSGRPFQEVSRLVRERRIDTVVLGAAEPASSSGRANSVRARLALERLGTSVFLARSGANERPTGSVFVPLDASERSEWSLGVAARLAGELGTGLCLGHVVARPEMPMVKGFEGGTAELARRVLEARTRLAERYLAGWSERLARTGVAVRTDVRIGQGVARDVQALVATARPPLVVLSAHGSSGAGGRIPGRVAGHLLEHAGTSVLVLNEGRRPRRDRHGARAMTRMREGWRRDLALRPFGPRGRPRAPSVERRRPTRSGTEVPPAPGSGSEEPNGGSR